MSEESTFERLKRILMEQLGVEEFDIDEHSRFREDLGADSLDTVEIVMACEDEWGIDLDEESDEKAEKCQTVGDAVKLIDEILAP